MRDILFRGKTVGGKWVEGAYYKQELFYGDKVDAHVIITSDEILTYDQALEFSVCIPETIGQYTGLTDKNGKKIFEGDIGRYKQMDGAKINGKLIICIGKVVYNEKTASFAVDSKDEIGAKNYDYFPIKDFEIIGNIHDNPELLKGGAE